MAQLPHDPPVAPAAAQYVERVAPEACLRVRGELSSAAGAELYRAVQALLAERPSEVRLDLAAVPRMDSLGGAWLVRVADVLRQAGVPWRIVAASGQVQDFLQLIRPTLETPPPPAAAAPRLL